MARCTHHALETRRSRLAAARLPRDVELLGPASQRFDLASGRLKAGLERNIALHGRDLAGIAGRLSPGLLDRPRALKAERLAELSGRLDRAAARAPVAVAERARLPQLGERLTGAFSRAESQRAERLRRLGQLLGSLNPERPLGLGFALVRREDGTLVRQGATLKPGEAVTLKFADETRRAVIGEAGQPPARQRTSKAPVPPTPQGDLF